MAVLPAVHPASADADGVFVALDGPALGLVFGVIGNSVVSGQAVVVSQAKSSEAGIASVAGEGGQFVRSLGEEVIAVLKSTDHGERKRRFHDIFTRAFDVEAMARFAAGSYWRRADQGQRQEYVQLFGDYVAALYAAKFADYSGQSFKVTGERPAGDDMVSVEGTIVQGQRPPVRVDFRLRRTDGDYKIVDVYVEGISLLITKRDEFTTVLSREGMAGLIERLRATSAG